MSAFIAVNRLFLTLAFLLIRRKLILRIFANAIPNKNDAIPKHTKLNGNKKLYQKTMHCKMYAIKYPNGVFESNGNLKIIN